MHVGAELGALHKYPNSIYSLINLQASVHNLTQTRPNPLWILNYCASMNY